ncbi:MAG: hypothetical protein AVDCRST_MAG02-1471, partial [uncultured Rubrobacteraceae bacterium]
GWRCADRRDRRNHPPPTRRRGSGIPPAMHRTFPWAGGRRPILRGFLHEWL